MLATLLLCTWKEKFALGFVSWYQTVKTAGRCGNKCRLTFHCGFHSIPCIVA